MFCSWRRSTLFFIDRIYNKLIIFVGILFLNTHWKRKLFLIAVLLISYLLSFFLVNGLAFFKNEILIVSIQMLFTIAMVLLTYFKFLKNKK